MVSSCLFPRVKHKEIQDEDRIESRQPGKETEENVKLGSHGAQSCAWSVKVVLWSVKSQGNIFAYSQ